MFGLGKKDSGSDKLNVQVHVVVSEACFQLAQKIWNENLRTAHLDQQTGKEFERFTYLNPKCAVWLQCDQGRQGEFELIVRWEQNKIHEVFVLTSGPAAGNEPRAQAILNSMLTTPSVVLSANN